MEQITQIQTESSVTETMAVIKIEGQEFKLEAALAQDDKLLKTVLQPHFSGGGKCQHHAGSQRWTTHGYNRQTGAAQRLVKSVKAKFASNRRLKFYARLTSG